MSGKIEHKDPIKRKAPSDTPKKPRSLYFGFTLEEVCDDRARKAFERRRAARRR